MIAHHVLSSDAWVDCQVLGHSMNSNCSAVRGVDCEHHMDGEVINQ